MRSTVCVLFFATLIGMVFSQLMNPQGPMNQGGDIPPYLNTGANSLGGQGGYNTGAGYTQGAGYNNPAAGYNTQGGGYNPQGGGYNPQGGGYGTQVMGTGQQPQNNMWLLYYMMNQWLW